MWNFCNFGPSPLKIRVQLQFAYQLLIEWCRGDYLLILQLQRQVYTVILADVLHGFWWQQPCFRLYSHRIQYPAPAAKVPRKSTIRNSGQLGQLLFADKFVLVVIVYHLRFDKIRCCNSGRKVPLFGLNYGTIRVVKWHYSPCCLPGTPTGQHSVPSAWLWYDPQELCRCAG